MPCIQIAVALFAFFLLRLARAVHRIVDSSLRLRRPIRINLMHRNASIDCSSPTYSRNRTGQQCLAMGDIIPFYASPLVSNDPNLAIGDRELVHEKRLKDGHGVAPLFAFPKCSHGPIAFPLRD